MFLITGAAGKTGLAIIRTLARRGMAVRGLVRRAEQGIQVQAAGANQVVYGDMAQAGVLAQAMVGVQTVYHICPNMHPDELEIGKQLIAAAQQHHLSHIVYHSVLHPQTPAMPHHWQKSQVEEKLFAAGIPYTILQPTAYMQNLLAGWPTIIEQGILANPYPVTTRLSLVDLQDVAEAAARVLTESGYFFATYELVGTEPLSQLALAETFSQVLNRPVTAQEIPLAQWQQNAAAHLSPYALDSLSKMFRYYAAYGLEGNPNSLHWLLTRPPTSLTSFITRAAAGA